MFFDGRDKIISVSPGSIGFIEIQRPWRNEFLLPINTGDLIDSPLPRWLQLNPDRQ